MCEHRFKRIWIIRPGVVPTEGQILGQVEHEPERIETLGDAIEAIVGCLAGNGGFQMAVHDGLVSAEATGSEILAL